ncbi:hypothetical protein MCAV_05530 [[Mycoplasma] cavipharyngis]|uniref:hypothetical protein n=1 Tax=[Mycoplasma] cavipharyngis TaxID=92757 RepID=UPI0037039841
MIDVSSYVLDPFDWCARANSDTEMCQDPNPNSSKDQTTRANSNNVTKSQAEAQYTNPIKDGVPRYFSLNNNQIQQIPRYYLKIKLAYFDLANNLLGIGTEKDPLGVYGIPWYSLNKSSNTEGLLPIQDPSIRGPYGINVYATSEKSGSGNSKSWKYTDEQVARWRSMPFPIRGLTFGNFNDVPDSNNQFDSNVTFNNGLNNNMMADSGGNQPYFNFANNHLVAPMIFSQSNVNYDPNAIVAPQTKSVNLFVGLDDFQKSKYHMDQKMIIEKYEKQTDKTPFSDNNNAELLVPEPDSIYPWINQIGQTKQYLPGTSYIWNTYSVYTIRSFNGYGLFEQKEDSRADGTEGNMWDNNVQMTSNGGNQQGQPDPYAGTSKNGSDNSQGIKWTVPKASDFKVFKNSSTNTSIPPNISDFISGKNGQDPHGWWGVKTFSGNWSSSFFMGNKSAGANHPIHWTRYKPFRTYLVSAKSFARSHRRQAYTPVYDGNVFYDATTTDNVNQTISLSPSGQTLNNTTGVNNKMILINLTSSTNPLSPTSGQQVPGLKSFFTNNNNAALFGLAPNLWLTNIKQPSSFGIRQGENTPYKSAYTNTNGLYSYTSYFYVVDQIESELQNEGNLAKEVKSPAGTNTNNNLNLSQYANKFAQVISAENILTGKNQFWKSSKQFDQVYLQQLDRTKVHLDFDDTSGTLKYQFKVYLPGYSANGRLLPKNHEVQATKNETRTIDQNINQTVKGFVKGQLQVEDHTGTWTDVDMAKTKQQNQNDQSESNTILLPAPKSIQDLIKDQLDGYDQITKDKIAATLKTNYLGNLLADSSKTTADIINGNHSDLHNVNQQYITNLTKDATSGTISFQVNVPSFKFSNNNSLEFPSKWKSKTFVYQGLKKLSTSFIGTSVSGNAATGASKLFNVDAYTSDEQKKKFRELIKKPASAVTAADLLDLNAVTTNNAEWLKKPDTEKQAAFSLLANNLAGTVTWTISLPADENKKIAPLIATYQWAGFSTTSTTIEWKKPEDLKDVLRGKSIDQVVQMFNTNPQMFFTVVSGGASSNNSITKADLVQEIQYNANGNNPNLIVDESRGTIQFFNVQLKNYYQHGVKFENGQPVNNGSSTNNTNPSYLTLPASAIYLFQRGVSKLNWKQDSEVISNIKNYLDTNNLIPAGLNKDKLTLFQIKQLIVTNNLKLTDLKIFELKNIKVEDVSISVPLSQLISSDDQKGTLSFDGIKVNNWQEDESYQTITKMIDLKVIQGEKITNTFVFSEQLSPFLINLSVPKIAELFADPKTAATYIDGLNQGVKTFDNDGKLLHQYHVDVTKVKVDLIKGKLKFESGAIKVTNFVEKMGEKPKEFEVTTAKEYDVGNKVRKTFVI